MKRKKMRKASTTMFQKDETDQKKEPKLSTNPQLSPQKTKIYACSEMAKTKKPQELALEFTISRKS